MDNLFNNKSKTQYYSRKEIIEDFKFIYLKTFKNYQLSNEDIEDLKKFLDEKKK